MLIAIPPTESQRIGRLRLAVAVAEDVNGLGPGKAEGDEDVGTLGGRVGDAVEVARGVVVDFEDDVGAGVGAFAGVVGGAFGGEAGDVVVAGEGAHG